MTQPTIEQLKEIIGKATKGPWKVTDRKTQYYDSHSYTLAPEGVGINDGYIDDSSTLWIADDHPYYNTAPSKDDAIFMAAARQALPAALDLIEEMAEALGRSTYEDGTRDSRVDYTLKSYEKFTRGEY